MNGNNVINKLSKIIVKTIFYSAVFTTLISCTDEKDTETPPNKKVYMSFVAGTKPITRTILTEDNNVEWEEGDEISLFDQISNNQFITAQKGSSVTFTGMANETSSVYYALYPYDKNATISGTNITTTLPTNQSPRPGSFAMSTNPSVAISSENRELYFRNTCAVVKFKLNCGNNNVVKAVLRGNNGEGLSGTINIDLASSDQSAQVQQDNSSTEVTLNGSLSTDNTYHFVVAPCTLSKGLTLILYDDQGNGYTRYGSNEIALKAGQILNLGTINATSFDAYTYSNGTYHIFNSAGMKEWSIQDDCLVSKVILENDIDMSHTEWTPIGNSIESGYSGNFNGNNKNIQNLKINSNGNVGFFGSIGKGAKVYNTNFSNADINGEGNSSYTGVIAGINIGIIEGCDVTNSKVSGHYVGSIAGNNSVQVNNCNAVNVEINSTYSAGGISGLSYGKIEYCTVSGNSKIISTGSSTISGGIVGSTSQEDGISTSGRILKCAVDGATISGKWAGGIAGENSFGIVAQCVINNTTITHASSEASTRLGGIVGYNTRGSVVACYSAYSTVGDNLLNSEAIGGIVGYNNNNNAYVYGCYSTHVSLYYTINEKEQNIGSIAGYTNGHVISCYAVLPEGATDTRLVGKGTTPEHCVESGSTDFSRLTDNVNNYIDDDGSIWIASEIWNITSSGYPTISSNYLGESPQN